MVGSIKIHEETSISWKNKTQYQLNNDEQVDISLVVIKEKLPATNHDDKSQTDKAQLISPQIVASDVQCVSFWYHMNENSNYNLVLYQNETVLNVLTTIWNISGDHGNTIPIKQ
jgi:hypothetical protein